MLGIYSTIDSSIPVDTIAPPPPNLITLKSLSAVANNNQVAVTWEIGREENNAGYRVWKGIPLFGHCSDNPYDYAEVIPITALMPTGAPYSPVIDSEVVSNMTYCYVLEDIDFDGKSTFHTEKIVPVTVN